MLINTIYIKTGSCVGICINQLIEHGYNSTLITIISLLTIGFILHIIGRYIEECNK